MPSDLRTQAIVLRRTNYGESDRILNLLTPEGKIAVLARGVRKAKSRLAGGIELFSLADVVVHQGRSSLGTLTSAKMLKFYGGILSDVARLELAGSILKQLDRVTEQVSAPEYFSLLQQSLQALDGGQNIDVISCWFTLNLRRIGGEEFNLIYDIFGEKLSPELHYYWDTSENALHPDVTGRISVSEIKLMRFLLSNPLAWATRIQNLQEVLPAVQEITKTLE